MLPDLVRRLHAHAVHGVDEMLRDARVDDGRILLVVGTLLQKIIETLARLDERRRHVTSRLLRHNEPCMQLLQRMRDDLAEDAQRLRQMTGQEFARWSI